MRSSSADTRGNQVSGQEIALTDIELHAGTQMRVSLHADVVQEYAELMAAGTVFPPVTVFSLSGQPPYLMASGFHRTEAAKQIGRPTITAVVKRGGLTEAIEYACEANATHGLRPHRLDREKAAYALLELHEDWADREIARRVGLSPSTVGKYRQVLDRGQAIEAESPDEPPMTVREDHEQRRQARASVQIGQVPESAPPPETRPRTVTRGGKPYTMDTAGLRRPAPPQPFFDIQTAQARSRSILMEWLSHCHTPAAMGAVMRHLSTLEELAYARQKQLGPGA